MAKKKTPKKDLPQQRSKPAKGSQAASEAKKKAKKAAAKKKAAAPKKPKKFGGPLDGDYSTMPAAEFKRKFPGVPLSRAKYGRQSAAKRYGSGTGPGYAPKTGNTRKKK